jgi:hypothetical protein
MLAGIPNKAVSLRVIGASHERTGHDLLEPHVHGLFSKGLEFIGMIETDRRCTARLEYWPTVRMSTGMPQSFIRLPPPWSLAVQISPVSLLHQIIPVQQSQRSFVICLGSDAEDTEMAAEVVVQNVGAASGL